MPLIGGGIHPRTGPVEILGDISVLLGFCYFLFECPVTVLRSPHKMHQQIIYSKNGLSNRKHTLKLVVRGSKNPLSTGTNVYIDALQWSNAEGANETGVGEGPQSAQRIIFGYTAREDYCDSNGNLWRPGLEVVVRLGRGTDSIAQSWWIRPRAEDIQNTSDPEIYKYGMHAKEFTAYFTVKPGNYNVCIKLAESRIATVIVPDQYVAKDKMMAISINAKSVINNFDIADKAGGLYRALDLKFNNIKSEHGIIAVTFKGKNDAEAIAQAIEILPI